MPLTRRPPSYRYKWEIPALIFSLVHRSIVVGLFSLIPNLLPLLMSAGFMGFAGISLNAGTAMTIGIAFVYYGFMRTGQALGHNGALPPYVAAWMGDVAFGAVGIVMMVQAQRR